MLTEAYLPSIVGGGSLFIQEISQRLSYKHDIIILTPAYSLKEGKYEDPKKNLPFEVLTLRGELAYREK